MRGLDRDAHEAERLQALAALRQGDKAPMAAWLRRHLFEHVLPFWEPLVDEENGGLFTCVSDAGEVIAGDKWLWSQWRAVWVCSRIFNTLDPDPKWRDRAQRIAGFCMAHGWLEEAQGWALLVDREGKLLRGYESIYVDAFAVYGMTELAQATGDTVWLQRAEFTAEQAMARIDRLGDQLPHWPYPISPGTKMHGIPMIWSLKLAGLGAATGNARWRKTARSMLQEIDTDFYEAEGDWIREITERDSGSASDCVAVTVPGHVIEALWFRRCAESSDVESVLPLEETWRRVQRHFELGWEEQTGGGLLLATNARGEVATEGWGMADLKLWWPVTEAMFAAVLGWAETGQGDWLDWYERLWRLAGDHYIDWEHGEWRQKLNRDLSPFAGTVALPVKDPFHLPRSLILQIELLERGVTPPAASVSYSP